MFSSGLSNFSPLLVVFFEVFRVGNKDFRIDQLRKTSDLTSAPGGITIVSGYSPSQASSLGVGTRLMLAMLVYSSFVSSRCLSVCPTVA